MVWYIIIRDLQNIKTKRDMQISFHVKEVITEVEIPMFSPQVLGKGKFRMQTSQLSISSEHFL